MENFTPITSFIGGLLVGLASVMLLLVNGRIAGISGIAGGALLGPGKAERVWRLFFLVGMIATGAILGGMYPEFFTYELARSKAAVVIAGLLVGFGTKLGNGCTSGHGVCGLSRGSRRSLFATATFMLVGMITVFVVNAVAGGVL
jgi:uncharacterized membrane protein YedE/YeeE